MHEVPLDEVAAQQGWRLRAYIQLLSPVGHAASTHLQAKVLAGRHVDGPPMGLRTASTSSTTA